MTKEVFDNVQGFISGKAPTAQVFDKIAPADLNEWLGMARCCTCDFSAHPMIR